MSRSQNVVRRTDEAGASSAARNTCEYRDQDNGGVKRLSELPTSVAPLIKSDLAAFIPKMALLPSREIAEVIIDFYVSKCLSLPHGLS